MDSCPKKISLKVIGGTSSCAEKVPWNVLVEHATSTNKAAGERKNNTNNKNVKEKTINMLVENAKSEHYEGLK